MKPKPKPVPLTSPQGGSVLDWPIESGLADSFLQQVETRRKQHRRRRRSLKTGATAVALALFAAFWAIPTYRDTATVQTTAARRDHLTLADGSQADLSAQTQLKTDFRYGRRHVTLTSGEAFFSVAKDPAHPFRVETPAGTVQVTGTRFNVRLDAFGSPEVTLIEGSVSFTQAGESTALSPSQQLTPAGLRTLTPAELDRVTAWRSGRFVFDGLTLAETAARLSAYHGVAISVAPEIATLRPGGSIPLDDLPAILHALETALEVRMLTQADGSRRILSR